MSPRHGWRRGGGPIRGVASTATAALLAAALCAAAATGPQSSSPQSSSPQSTSPETIRPEAIRGIPLLADGAAGERIVGPNDLRLRVGDAELPIIGVEPIERWEIVIAIDPILSTSRSGERAATLLTEGIDALVGTGDVELVLVDSWIDTVKALTDDTDSLAAAIGGIPRLGTFGRLESLGRSLGSSASADDRREAARQALRLVRWQREALFDWLLARRDPGPRALILLQDAYRGRPGAFGLEEPELDPTGSPALDDGMLGATLAAAGWTVFPLRPRAEEIGEAATPHETNALAEATGGVVIRSSADLLRAVDLLAGARQVAFALEAPPSFPLASELVPTVELPADSRISSPRWLGAGLLPGLGGSRARRLLTLDEDGPLEVSAALHREGPDPHSVVVEIAVDLGPSSEGTPTSAWLSPALYVERLDAVPLEVELRGRGEPLAGVDRWVAQLALPPPVDAVELVAVVSVAGSGPWGAARIEEGDGRLARNGPGQVVEPFDLRPTPPLEQEASTTTQDETTIVLLAPRGGRLEGRQRFRTLVTTVAIHRTEFYLDGKLVEADDEAPYGARIDLGADVTRHTVEVRAYDAAGNLVGTDSIRLNEPFRSIDVSIDELEVNRDTSRLRLRATVEHPTDVAVDRVEYYHNESLLGSSAAPPWSFEGPTGTIGSTDYVRVVAYFDDGRFLEDVRLVSSPGSVEEVEVNLVQVYVVATDPEGDPVADLTADDFRIQLGGEIQRIQRFAYADEVPLELALVIDTSPSMWPLMPDTRKAAARFLTQVVGEKDRALVIDFDTRPRVAHPLSGDLGDLLVSLGGLEAEQQGTTALYDSVIFAALELPRGQQRKAVVLLTDGDDYRSRFSLGRAIDTAQQAGVPVYVVSLAGIQDPRRQFRRTDLDALTAETGGEAYYLGALANLGPTYDKIARELRSQYLLAFPTTRQLSDDDLESLEVRVGRRDLELSTVVGGRSVN